MNDLHQLGLAKDSSQVAKVFAQVAPNWLAAQGAPSSYVKSVWSEYKSRFGVANQNLNGKLFELILATVLIREDILPFYVSVEVAFVPNVVYDLMVYDCAAGPVCISAKTSLRERYKQADLEAYVLKNVHRRAKYYLVTLNHEEADSLKSKLQAGELIGIDRVVIADSTEFDELVATLKELNLCAPPKVDVFTGASSVTTEKVEHLRKRPSTR